MRAITLWQPWATLIAIGAKRIETRGWHAGYTGPLAIHAARRCERYMMEDPLVRDALTAAGLIGHPLPAGAIVAVCELKRCAPTTQLGLPGPDSIAMPGLAELRFGDYRPGRFAWFLENVRPLAVPIPATGRQRFFLVPNELFTAEARCNA